MCDSNWKRQAHLPSAQDSMKNLFEDKSNANSQFCILNALTAAMLSKAPVSRNGYEMFGLNVQMSRAI